MDHFKKIALSGKMCSGKTTLSQYLSENLGYSIYSIASPMKEIAGLICGYNILCKSDKKFEYSGFNVYWNKIIDLLIKLTKDEYELESALKTIRKIIEKYYKVININNKTQEVRTLYQDIGNFLRDTVNKDIWINFTIKNTQQTELVIIDDLRYKNEYRVLRDNNFVIIRLNIDENIRLSRIQKLYSTINESAINHISEIDLDLYIFDYNINCNSSIDKAIIQFQDIIGGKIYE